MATFAEGDWEKRKCYIFEEQPDGRHVWVCAVASPEEARARLNVLIRTSRNGFIACDVESGAVVAENDGRRFASQRNPSARSISRS